MLARAARVKFAATSESGIDELSKAEIRDRVDQVHIVGADLISNSESDWSATVSVAVLSEWQAGTLALQSNRLATISSYACQSLLGHVALIAALWI